MQTVPLTIINSEPTTLRQFAQAFRKYQHLLGLLIWRDMSVRYRQTAIGVTWVILQPISFALIFTFIFGHLAQLPSDGVPYLVFAYAGAVIWRLFAQGIDRSCTSILSESSLITKVYFPRWLLPLAYIGGAFFDFLISLAILFILVLFMGINPGWHLLLLLPAIILTLLLTACLGTAVGLLCCKYRDFSFLTAFSLQVFQFVTPVFYSVTLFGEKMRLLAYLNPLTGPLELFRLGITGASHFWWPGFLLSLLMDLLVIFTASLIVFRLEDELVDII